MNTPIETTDHAGHRYRTTLNYFNNGIESFQPYAALEFFLMRVIPRRDVKPLAKRLIAHFGSVDNVFNADSTSLKKISGVGDSVITAIQLFKNLGDSLLSTPVEDLRKISSAYDAVSYVRNKVTDYKEGGVMVLFLNTREELLHSARFRNTEMNGTFGIRQIATLALEHCAKRIFYIKYQETVSDFLSEDDTSFYLQLQIATDSHDIILTDYMLLSAKSFFSTRTTEKRIK